MYNKDGSTFYSKNGTLQITLNGPGCYYQKRGYCKMCNYGGGENTALPNAVKFVDRAIRKFPKAKRILVGSNGSILDEREIPRSIVAAVLERIGYASIEDIYIETHAHTITMENLAFLREKLPKKNITVEMGLESSNQSVLDKIISKYLKISTLEEAVKLIHKHGMKVSLNVLFGIWGMDADRMQRDFITTCTWANEIGTDEIVLFLLHIKPETYVYELYRQGKLVPPTHLDFIATLSKLDDQILRKIYFSWFGERKEVIEHYGIIAPNYGTLNPEDTIEFYCSFMKTPDISEKRRLIENILQPRQI